MSTNDYLPHIHIIPEDRADEEIANGFVQSLSLYNRSVQVLGPRNGWKKVRDCLNDDQFTKLRSGRGRRRILILLIDFDEDPSRLQDFKQRIPSDLLDRLVMPPSSFQGTYRSVSAAGCSLTARRWPSTATS
jgi:hypothetical protein